FLAGLHATPDALPLLNAATQTPPPPSPAAGAKPGAPKSLFPTYAAVTGGPKPDFHDDNPLYSDAFDNYPSNPFKPNQSAPGTGSLVNVLIPAYFPVPTPIEQNPTWQAVNQALNSDVRMNIIPGGDYRLKFPTVMASDDLPDIMH